MTTGNLLIIGGTSLVVYPAAGFIDYFNGDSVVLINKSSTGYDTKAFRGRLVVSKRPIGCITITAAPTC